MRYVNTQEGNVTYIDLVGLFSTFIIGLALATAVMDRIYGDAKSDRRHQAHRR